MKTINYADHELLAGDEIAAAIINYASALANADKSDTVTIPTRVDSVDQSATFLIGPASQVVITEGDPGGEEQGITRSSTISTLERRAWVHADPSPSAPRNTLIQSKTSPTSREARDARAGG